VVVQDVAARYELPEVGLEGGGRHLVV
jgi:hypothetical protein